MFFSSFLFTSFLFSSSSLFPLSGFRFFSSYVVRRNWLMCAFFGGGFFFKILCSYCMYVHVRKDENENEVECFCVCVCMCVFEKGRRGCGG